MLAAMSRDTSQLNGTRSQALYDGKLIPVLKPIIDLRKTPELSNHFLTTEDDDGVYEKPTHQPVDNQQEILDDALNGIKEGSDTSELEKLGDSEIDSGSESVRDRSWEQLRNFESRLQRFSKPGIGRAVCQACGDGSRITSRDTAQWLLESEELLTNPSAELTPLERARMTARLLTHDSAAYALLSSRLVSPLDGTMRQVRHDAQRLLDQLAECLASELPIVFDGATAELVGDWAQDTALVVPEDDKDMESSSLAASCTLDFILCLPQWRRTNRVCLCRLRPRSHGANVLAVHRSTESVDFETSLHQACISTIERAVLHRAVQLLDELKSIQQAGQGSGESSLELKSAGASQLADPGSDDIDHSRPKSIQLCLIWRDTPDAGLKARERQVTINLQFGLPVILTQRSLLNSREKASSLSDSDRVLHGHLLFGLSRPRLLRLATEEARALDNFESGSKEGPVRRLVRMLKFVLRLGDCLAADCRDTELVCDEKLSQLADQSYSACWAAREVVSRYAACLSDAFQARNAEERFLEGLRLLRSRASTSTGASVVPVFAESARLARIFVAPLTTATLRLMDFFEQQAMEGRSEQSSGSALRLLEQSMDYYRQRSKRSLYSKNSAEQQELDLRTKTLAREIADELEKLLDATSAKK